MTIYHKPKPKDETRRIKRRFLLFPLRLGNITKLMCIAYIEEVYRMYWRDGEYYWFKIKFVDKQAYKAYKKNGVTDNGEIS